MVEESEFFKDALNVGFFGKLFLLLFKHPINSAAFPAQILAKTTEFCEAERLKKSALAGLIVMVAGVCISIPAPLLSFGPYSNSVVTSEEVPEGQVLVVRSEEEAH